VSDIQSMRATLSAATTAETKLVAAQAIQAFREQPIVPPSRSAQFESYKAAILRGEATPGMLEQIAADERLQDGEDEALLRLAEQHAARRVSAEAAASVAASIRQQLGGQKFAVMTGATNFVSHNDTAYGGLSFKLPSNFAKDGINYVKVLLNESDTYDLTFGKIRGTNYTVLKTVEGVYADNLRETFTDTTGLDVSLGTGGPAPAGGRVTKTEARDAYDALDYLVTSYKQQHDSEFLRADVNERLTPRMDRVRALMARGWPDGATGDPQSLLNHAQDALSRLKRLQDSGLTDDMGRGEAWSYLTNDKGLTGAQADVILATPTSTRMSGTIEQPRYTVAYLNEAAGQATKTGDGMPDDQLVVADPVREADEQFLRRILAGDFSLNDEELFGALEQIGERHASDESMIALFTEAANKVTEAATEAARAAI